MWWAAAAVAVAALAAYVSFVPFEFARLPPGTTVGEALRASLEMRWASRTNLVANAVMFVPFGFFGAGAMVDDRSRPWRWLAAACVLLPASVLLSVAIEVAQVFVPGRTPSLLDIFFQTAGTGIGYLLWALLARDIRAWFSQFLAGSRGALEVGLAAYAAVRFVLLLEPFDVTVELSSLVRKFRAGGIVFNPLHSPALQWDALPSLLSDVVLAVPVGVLVAIGGMPRGTSRRASAALGLGMAVFVAGELAQVLVRSRTADIVDLAANGLGVAAGVALAAALTSRAAATGAAPATARQRRVLSAALAAAVALYALYNLSPFDFTLSREFVAGRLGRLARVPLHGYYENQEFKALADLLTKIGLAIPLGVLFHLRFRPDSSVYRRTLTIGWLALTGVFFALVELGQVLLPSRFPESSDILLGVAGVWLGAVLARRFSARPDSA